jgi:hypothetical protein
MSVWAALVLGAKTIGYQFAQLGVGAQLEKGTLLFW